jgi:ABC-type multidrug transport system fused ATPase/permease subunit
MALQNSQFEEVIKNFEEGDNAIVGENGVNFSGGQKKRLAIARALYRNPELIIFDESTSSLDLENEKKIFQILGEVKKNRCIIIISHNKKTLEYCDKIFQLKNTNIFEEKIV